MASILEWQEKHRTKLTIIALGMMALCGFVIYSILTKSSSGDSKQLQLSEATNVEEAKIVVDNLINSWDGQYNLLCSGPRNGTTKEKFTNLAFSISGEIAEVGDKCEKLDGNLQIEVSKYARERMKQFPHLEELSDQGNIKCW